MNHILGYEIQALIGKGSFSEVYKARKGLGPGLDQIVAIKVMKPPTKSLAHKIMSSLRYEFWVLKDLSHPNIVRLFDFGELDDGRVYLIEEFVSGVPLDVFCVNHSFGACEPALIDLFKALKELERVGVVHGDIKTANILVTGTGESASAKLLDFGDGGTPSFMAPEVILQRPSDHRCDLYSLGVTIYASLTGKNPFAGKTIDATLKAHLHKKPDPIGLLRHDVPPVWQELIHGLMEKNPDDRPATALKALSLIQKDSFVLSPTDFVGREKLLSQALAIERALVKGAQHALVVTGKSGVGVTRFLREVFYRLIAAHPNLRERISLVLSPSHPDTPILLLDRLKPPAGYPVINIKLEPFTVEEVRDWLKRVFFLEKIPQKFLDKIFSLTSGHAQSLWELLELLSEKAVLADSAGRVTQTTLAMIDWDEILPSLNTSVGLWENIDWLFAEAKKKIGMRTLTEKNPLWKKMNSLIEREKNPKIKTVHRAGFLALKGEALIDEGKLEPAKEALTGALEIFKTVAECKIDEIRVQNFLSYILLRQGKPKEAVHQFEATLTEIQKHLNPEEAKKITNLDLGAAYLQAGDFPKAIARLKEEREFHRSSAVVREIGCLYNLAQAYSSVGDRESAESHYHDVIARARTHKEHAYFLRALNGLGNVLKDSNRWQEALQAFGEALEIALALNDFSSAAAAAQNRGALAATKGLHQEAVRDLTDALGYVEKTVTPYAFEKFVACRSRVELAEIFLIQKRFDEARDHLDRAWHMAEKDKALADFRFWVLLTRCRLWQALDDDVRFKEDRGRLNFYADTDDKKKKVEALGVESESRSSQAQTHEFHALIKITSDLLAEILLPDLLKKILSYALELSGAELGVVLLNDAKTLGPKSELKPVASLNAELSAELRDISLSVAKEVVSSGKIVQASDAIEEQPFAQHASVLALNLRSIVALPLTFRGKVLGVLYLSHRYRPGLFDERIIQILSVFADQAALAITNHQLLEFHRQAEQKAVLELEETRKELTIFKERLKSLPAEVRDRIMAGPFKTRSQAVLEILGQMGRVAETRLAVVIQGETGTGKELLARYVHDISPRKNSPFVAINCGALPATLIEGELFGHVKGAFTGADRDKLGLIEAATGGTLFLDEIIDLPLAAQVKLLRVLQERQVVRLGETKPRSVDIRLIVALQKNLKEAVSDGSFREDLYYRLMGLTVSVPPLRERPEDIPLLAEFFLNEYLKETQKKHPAKIAVSFLRVLTQYHWPGNVRELKNVIHTAAVLCDGKLLTVKELPKNIRDQLLSEPRKALHRSGESRLQTSQGWYHPGWTWAEHLLLIYASSLMALKHNVPRVAASLGVGVATVYKWKGEHRLEEAAEYWQKKVLPYREGLKLRDIRALIFSQVALKFPGHPYHAARELDVAPVTFYRWSRAQK